MPELPKQNGQGETESDTKSSTKESETEGESMKEKVTNAEAVKAADVLRKYCMQFQAKKTFCRGCIFYWKDAPMRYSFCRLDRNPVGYNLRSPKKQVEKEVENA